MTDKDLYPCPYCRSERVSTCQDDSEGFPVEVYFVFCESCEFSSPSAGTEDKARQVYNVVAKLIDDIFNTLSWPDIDNIKDYSMLMGLRQKFMEARREYAPY